MSHWAATLSMVVYDIVLALVSTTLLILLLLLLSFLCKKRSVEPEDNITIRPTIRACSLTDVDAATDSFHPHRILGKGRLGTVYGAVLATGEVVAVKRIHPHLVLSNAAGSSFSSAIKSLSSAHHPHVLPILGFSEAPGERIVVMAYMGMHSLDYHLHGQDDDATALLDWKRRVRIAAEAARGIEYLHEGTAPNIVHGCIKPSNILIDFNFHARISDYGLNFLAVPQEWRGLVGYLDGEYWTEKGGVCKDSDVYGFGVVLLELVSGRRCEEGLIVRWALPLIKELRVEELLDPRLVMPSDVRPLVRLAKVASACVSNSRKNRPSIVQVAAILNSLEMEMEMEMEMGP